MLVHFNISLGKAKSAVKHSSVCKPPNQHINGKEEKGKKKNDNRIAFE